MHKRRSVLALILVVALGLAAGSALAADPGVTATEIKLGNTNPYSGPASAYGTIGKSIGAYFKKINEEGGINGRKINFVTLDDAYSPPKAVEMVRKLVEQDQVLLLFQTLGTPSNSAIHKYMNDEQVPQLFVATGATKWGDPKGHPWTMGWQPTYQAEGHIYAQYVLKNVPGREDRDPLPERRLREGLPQGLQGRPRRPAAKAIVLEQSYEVTDPTVDSQIVNLKNSGANVFFNVTTPKFAAQAIKKAADIGWKPIHLLNNVSASVGAVLKPAGLDASKGLITVQYLKDPTDPQWKNDQGYKDWVVVHGQVLSGREQDGRLQRLRLLGGPDDGPGAQAGRQRPLARQRHEAGREPEGLRRPDGCCPASRSTRARRTSTRSSRSSSRSSTASAGCSSARSSTPARSRR